MPADDVTAFRKGVELLKKGSLEDAIRALEEAATTGEDLPVEHFALAVAYEKARQPASAIEQYRRFLEMAPRDESKIAYARQHLARLEAGPAQPLPPAPVTFPPAAPSTGPPATAPAPQASPATSAAASEIAAGEAALAAGDSEGAVRRFRRAIELDGANAAAWSGAGKAIFQAGLREALAHFEKAVALAPRLAGAHFNLGVVANLLHDTARARVAFETALSIHPDDAEAAEMIAILSGR